MVNPRQLVDSPTFTPLPFGLFSVVSTPDPVGTHWQNGITYQTRCLNQGNTTYDECISVTGTGHPPAPLSKSNTATMELRGATPFTVFTEFDCAPIGIDNASQVARDALAQTESWQVERAFWTGQSANQSIVFPHLSSNSEITDNDGILLQTNPVIVTGMPDIVCALGLLEEQLANCYNGVGVIHVSRRALPTLSNNRLIEQDGNRLRTTNGNLVAIGSGYPEVGPGDVNPTGQCSIWMIATGHVFMYRSEVRIIESKESIDRAENTVKMIAERTYVLGWDCCHAAIKSEIGVTDPGTSGA